MARGIMREEINAFSAGTECRTRICTPYQLSRLLRTRAMFNGCGRLGLMMTRSANGHPGGLHSARPNKTEQDDLFLFLASCSWGEFRSNTTCRTRRRRGDEKGIHSIRCEGREQRANLGRGLVP